MVSFRFICMLFLAGCSRPSPVLVVGAGPAGLAAAIEASGDRPVILLDAADQAGGSALWATAATVLPVRTGTHPHLDRLRTDGVDWLKDQGLVFEPTSAPAPRGFESLQPVGGGPQLVAVLVDRARQAGVELRTGCAVNALTPSDGWTATTDACGVFTASSVVLATGGVLGNDAARRAWVGAQTPRLSPASTASTGLELTAGLGASRFDEGRMLWFDHVSAIGDLGRCLVAPPSAVALGPAGERRQGALRGYGPGVEDVAWAIISGADRARTQLYDVDRGELVSLSRHLSEGGGSEAHSLAEVAVHTGIAQDKLSLALRRRTPRGPGPLPDGPHAVVRLQKAPAKQLGGLRADARGRLLDASGRPIQGLFGAGELTGFLGLHAGQSPIDSTMVVGAVVTGRVAGKEAVKAD